MKFLVGGVEIRIDFSFFLIIAFSLITESGNVMIILAMSALHEAGHIASLYILGGEASAITLSCYGIALRQKNILPPGRQLAFLISGVLVNLLFYFFGTFSQINLMLFALNVLPIYPLDGGRALKLLFDCVFKLDASDKIFRIISVIIYVFLIIFSLYSRNISFIMIVIYSIAFSINNSYD